MGFKEILKEKVPAHLQETPEFPIILKLIDQEKITNAITLKHWLNVAMEKCENDLKEFGKAGSTMNRNRVKCAARMQLLHLVRDKILPYVK